MKAQAHPLYKQYIQFTSALASHLHTEGTPIQSTYTHIFLVIYDVQTDFYQNVKDHRPKSIILYANWFHNYATAAERASQYQIQSKQSYLLYMAMVTAHATTRR